jgi:hypothetical protein
VRLRKKDFDARRVKKTLIVRGALEPLSDPHGQGTALPAISKALVPTPQAENLLAYCVGMMMEDLHGLVSIGRICLGQPSDLEANRILLPTVIS